jgi:4-hydroxybenzoate polyprenyltransferase
LGVVDPLPLVVELERVLTRADVAAEGRLLGVAGWFGVQKAEPDPLTLPLDDIFAEQMRAETARRPVLLVGSLSATAMEVLARRIGPSVQALVAPDGEGRLRVVRAALGDRPFAVAADGSRSAVLRAGAAEALPVPKRETGFALQALRPHHWVKNLLVFVPILAAHRWGEAGLWLQAALAFAAFCLTSSAVYLTNDLFDIEDDRAHPIKRLRPLASGQMRPGQALALAALLLAAGLLLATKAAILPALLVYAVASGAYSLKLKTMVGIDLIWLVGLYLLRLVAGGMATGIAVSGWLLAYGCFVFASLALAKRCAELAGAGAGDLPLPGRRAYRLADRGVLTASGLAAAAGSVVVMGLYLQEAETLYARPGWLILAAALVLAWLLRVWWLASRNRLHADPIIFALRDPASLAAGVAALTLLVLATGR